MALYSQDLDKPTVIADVSLSMVPENFHSYNERSTLTEMHSTCVQKRTISKTVMSWSQMWHESCTPGSISLSVIPGFYFFPNLSILFVPGIEFYNKRVFFLSFCF